MLSMNFWFFLFTIFLMACMVASGFLVKQLETSDDETFYKSRNEQLDEEVRRMRRRIRDLEQENDELREQISKMKD